ncbi:hypothetical protein BD309DRAFT_1017669 [Dichomitus squalens]|nr:hypothetical protein BD309DRAFT_1017669 [Dichomitus squalens]
MAAAPASLKHQLQKIAGRWAEDPFRPNVQLKTFLASLAEHPNLTPAAVRATRALEEGEFKKKYPLSDKIFKPASMPHHYTRLLEAFEKAAQGIARPWWKIFFNIW